MEDELHSSQQQYRQCLDELEQFERKIHELEREIAQGKELNAKYSRDVSISLSLSLSVTMTTVSRKTVSMITVTMIVVMVTIVTMTTPHFR